MPLTPTTYSSCVESTPPAPQCLLPGLLPAQTVGLLGASAEFGKTSIALQMSLGIASGMAVLGITPTSVGPVLFLELESSKETLCRRITDWLTGLPDGTQAWVEDMLERNLIIATPDYSQPFIPGEVMDVGLHDLLGAKGLLEADLKLIVIDTLATVAVGDENAVEPTRQLWAQANYLCAITGATVLLLHHTGKAKFTQQGQPVDKLSPDRLRGSSAHVAAARFVIQGAISSDTGSPWMRHHQPDMVRATFALTKWNDGPRPKAIEAIRSNDTKGFWELFQPADGLDKERTKTPTNKMTELFLAACRLHAADGRVDRKTLNEAADQIGMNFTGGLRNLRDKGLIDGECQPTKAGLSRYALLSASGASPDEHPLAASPADVDPNTPSSTASASWKPHGYKTEG